MAATLTRAYLINWLVRELGQARDEYEGLTLDELLDQYSVANDC